MYFSTDSRAAAESLTTQLEFIVCVSCKLNCLHYLTKHSMTLQFKKLTYATCTPKSVDGRRVDGSHSVVGPAAICEFA